MWNIGVSPEAADDAGLGDIRGVRGPASQHEGLLVLPTFGAALRNRTNLVRFCISRVLFNSL